MKKEVKYICMATMLIFLSQHLYSAVPLDHIRAVEINQNRSIVVNDKPFFPIMIWLQDPENFPQIRSAGINTVAGYWPKSGGTKDVVEYMTRIQKFDFYGVMPFDQRLKTNPALLGYIHDDEPDLHRLESDLTIIPGSNLAINKKTPLWKIFDGVSHTWSVLDPMQDAQFTLQLKQPEEIQSLGFWLTISKGLAVVKEITVLVDGKQILKAKLEKKKVIQKFDLAKPVSCKEITFKVISAYPDEQAWGSIGEIEGFDREGKNVLLSPPKKIPRKWPQETLTEYRKIKNNDPSRPVFMTVTGHFLPFFRKWSEEESQKLYPGYVKATDIIGYDIYPIYGWNKPEWLHLVHDGTEELVRLAGSKPVYAWIETSRGGQWTGPLERQKPVTPAHIRAEVWMAICRGATAIGYFTHIWKPSYKQFGVPSENIEALKNINEQITRLAPAILADSPKIKASINIEGGIKADILIKEYNSFLYLFTVNYDSRQKGGQATIQVPGLKSNTKIEVVDENRVIKADRENFKDTFGPLKVHIYKIKL